MVIIYNIPYYALMDKRDTTVICMHTIIYIYLLKHNVVI